MSLKEKLKSIKPRENSGSVSANRFDYQKNWAICKLIDLSKENDFLLAFEYYEDIIVFNSSDNPDSIDFYQVKTNNKHHSLSMLLRRSQGKNSIIGKLFKNKISFDTETKSLNLIANCNFKVKLKSGKEFSTYLCCNDLDDSEKKKLKEKLIDELSITWFEEYFKILFLNKSDLTLDHHSDLTQIKLSNYIESNFNDAQFKPSLAYRTIFDQVKRKNNYEKQLNSFEGLVKHKSISKADFESLIKVVVKEPKRIYKLKNEIITKLDSEGGDLQFRRFFKKNWSKVEVEYLRPNNLLFKSIADKIEYVIDDNGGLLGTKLIESMSKILPHVLSDKIVKGQRLYDKNFIKIMILKELCDGE
ncbi:dsDNA nuclease domain-containing protein [Aureibaculum sp. 2210JD6-5]|uniref:dsDNA nuclease domain-containing protein n=1 Tax=Aureibaculum sp. 2210JD6-5 TaxID=3103957 RepID=UPI002AAC65DF|nr:dsDNA nuclease domain-containing protein [Aureibaculum sp. 2210JD6-5]MDY7394055.1 dsDNA nuclease domain-containing protein [Aureibaculum sp. 2210JD6-5]